MCNPGDIMSLENKFKEEDRKKVVNFLNMVTKYARFNVDTTELIEYFQGLSYMHKVVLPKIEANCLEVKQYVEREEKSAEIDENK